MPTHYDDIAEQYKRSKAVDWRHHIEQHSLAVLLGDISGKAILDLACGEGHYTRLLRALGGARVMGVDLSPRMIELAEENERQQPLGVRYQTGDARYVQAGENFDLVVAAYLLNYARTQQELLEMCRAVARHLKPGGRFVTVNNNPLQRPDRFEATRKYGFVKAADEEIVEGTPIRYIFYLDSETFSIENYHLNADTHEWALRETGLSGVAWHPVQLSPAEAGGENRAHWDDFFVGILRSFFWRRTNRYAPN